MDIPVRFLAIFKREATFLYLTFASCTLRPFSKGVYLERKEFASKGSKFFPFNVDHFSEGRQNNSDSVNSHAVYPFPLTLSSEQGTCATKVLTEQQSSKHRLYLYCLYALVLHSATQQFIIYLSLTHTVIYRLKKSPDSWAQIFKANDVDT